MNVIKIYPESRKVFIKGHLNGLSPEEYLELIFNDLPEFKIDHEKIVYSYPKVTEKMTTTLPQAGD